MAASGVPNVGEMFAVDPKKDCPHVQSLVSGLETLSIDIKKPCSSCGNVGENWLCLTCSMVYCSRYVSSHMVEHNSKEPSHMVALSFSDMSVWCYDCDNYMLSCDLDAVIRDAEKRRQEPPQSKSNEPPEQSEQTCSPGEQMEHHSSGAEPSVQSETPAGNGASTAGHEMQSPLTDEGKGSLSKPDDNSDKPCSSSEQREHHSSGAEPSVQSETPAGNGASTAGHEMQSPLTDEGKGSLSKPDDNSDKPCSSSEQREHHSSGAEPSVQSETPAGNGASTAGHEMQSPLTDEGKGNLSKPDDNSDKPCSSSEQREHHSSGAEPSVQSETPAGNGASTAGHEMQSPLTDEGKGSFSKPDDNSDKPCSSSEQREHHSSGAEPSVQSETPAGNGASTAGHEMQSPLTDEGKGSFSKPDDNSDKPCSSSEQREHHSSGSEPSVQSETPAGNGASTADHEMQTPLTDEGKGSLSKPDDNSDKPCSSSEQREHHSSGAEPSVQSETPAGNGASTAGHEMQSPLTDEGKGNLSKPDDNSDKPCSSSEQREHHSSGAEPSVQSETPAGNGASTAGHEMQSPLTDEGKGNLSKPDDNSDKPCSSSEQREHHSSGSESNVQSETPAENGASGAGNKTQSPQADEKNKESRPFNVESVLPKEVLLSRMRAVLYGNCIGDAIGLLTEFMTKEEAQQIYATKIEKSWRGRTKTIKIEIKDLHLEYEMKHDDFHRSRWSTGDWTDDSDQMILILRTLYENHGEVDILDFAAKFRVWAETGYKELGDYGGCGLGQTTFRVLTKKDFPTDPHKCARQVWEESGKWVAPNGGVMRTSVLGIQDFSDMTKVIKNTKQICMVTHTDPRCVASCIAVTTAIALMLQGKHCSGNDWKYDVREISEEAFKYACDVLDTEEQKDELRTFMFAKSLGELELGAGRKIGYTYKCLGAGFWAYRQKNFKAALTELVMEAGDADTNGAVAGALLGCKLGVIGLPSPWLEDLLHKKWLDKQIDRYFKMLGLYE